MKTLAILLSIWGIIADYYFYTLGYNGVIETSFMFWMIIAMGFIIGNSILLFLLGYLIIKYLP